MPSLAPRARRTDQRARYCRASPLSKSTSAQPALDPRRSSERTSWAPRAAGSSSPRPTTTVLRFASRGVRSNSATHMASSSVLLPAPVGPVIANTPAPASGPCARSISNSPARPREVAATRIARILTTRPAAAAVTARPPPDPRRRRGPRPATARTRRSRRRSAVPRDCAPTAARTPRADRARRAGAR